MLVTSLVSGVGWLSLQAGAPLSARESLYEGEDKKNPGNEGYGPLQGRASASYSPYTTRLDTALILAPVMLQLFHLHCTLSVQD